MRSVFGIREGFIRRKKVKALRKTGNRRRERV